jgi:cyclic pyranopterin phosphate synthase
VTHDGYLKGCLNRNDDLRSLGGRSKPEMREALRRTVAERVPYYGEYLVQDDDGEWVFNEAYRDVEGDRSPYEYSREAEWAEDGSVAEASSD